MSMDYSEFMRQLGADPASQDPAFLSARESSPEFARAAEEADRFEKQLRLALGLSAPRDLLFGLQQAGRAEQRQRSAWRHYALAALILLAAISAGVVWRMNPEFDSVEQYVAYHYAEDGAELVTRGEGRKADNVEEVLKSLHIGLTPEARRMVGLVKFCPTPGGRGAHLVFNTAHGPITVIFMPDTQVTDGEMLRFDGMQAQLLALATGSAAVIGTENQQVSSFYDLLHGAFIPLTA